MGVIKSTWSSVELNLPRGHLFWITPDVSLAVKHFSDFDSSQNANPLKTLPKQTFSLIFSNQFAHTHFSLLKNCFMLSVRLSSYGWTQEVWRAL